MSNFATAQSIPTSTKAVCSLTELLANYPSKSFKKGSTIIQESTTAKYIFYVEKGKVLTLCNYAEETKALSNGYVLEQQFINLYSLTTGQSSNQAAKALTEVSVKMIPLLAFHTLMRNSYALHQIVLQSLVQQTQKATQQMHQMVLKSSNQRIIQFLLDYVKETGNRVGYEWVARDFFTQSQIALLTNTGRQTVSTLLNELRRQRIIHFTKKYLIIRELEKLKKMV